MGLPADATKLSDNIRVPRGEIMKLILAPNRTLALRWNS